MTAPDQLTVELGERSYPILIGDGLLEDGVDISGHLAADSCLIVTDSNVDKHYGETAEKLLGSHSLGKVVLPPGEAHKNLAAVESIIDALTASGAGRAMRFAQAVAAPDGDHFSETGAGDPPITAFAASSTRSTSTRGPSLHRSCGEGRSDRNNHGRL